MEIAMENSKQQSTGSSLKDTTGPSDTSGKLKANPETADTRDVSSVWTDEKAAANTRHDRTSAPSKVPPLGDALAAGGGQQSTPYQLETQADALAKQSNRGDV
jgi:hypothetical protein